MKQEIPIQKSLVEGAMDHSLSLSEMLPKERIRINVKVEHWRDAIREAGKLLHSSGAVREEYIEAMIQVAQDLGPYIVIAPGIALPHASTKAGALQTALSLVILENPVAFGNPDNDPVRLVFGLSAIDHKAHIVALQTLAELFLSKDLVEELMNAKTVDSAIRVIHKAEEIGANNG